MILCGTGTPACACQSRPKTNRLVDRRGRGPLDKSEGPVKTNLSLAMRRHRDLGQRSRRRRLWKASVFLNHPLVEGFAFAFCRSTNHRFGPTATMILLFEHPTSMLGARAPNQTLGRGLAGQGTPRAALDANDLWIWRAG